MHNVILPPNPEEELERSLQQAGQRQLTKQERKRLKKQRKQEERKRERSKGTMRKIGSIAAIILVIGGGIFALGWFFSKQPNLPPTTQQNHSEQSPPAHIVTTPIADAIQRHMLEHADGGGPPGVIVQYNCRDFACEPTLIENLTSLVQRYPENVYLAPNSYDGKIILTKLGRREILDAFNEQAIEDFIGQ